MVPVWWACPSASPGRPGTCPSQTVSRTVALLPRLKPVGLVLVDVKIRLGPNLFHERLELLGRGNRDQFVLVAQEHDGRRDALGMLCMGEISFQRSLRGRGRSPWGHS